MHREQLGQTRYLIKWKLKILQRKIDTNFFALFDSDIYTTVY